MELLSETRGLDDISARVHSWQAQPDLAVRNWPAVLRIVQRSSLAECAWLFDIQPSGDLGELIAQVGNARLSSLAAIANIQGERIPAAPCQFHWFNTGESQFSLVMVGGASSGLAVLLFLLDSTAPPTRRDKLEEVVTLAHERILGAASELQIKASGQTSVDAEKHDPIEPLPVEPLAAQLPFGVLLIDENHHIYFQNSAARMLLQNSAEVRASNHRLVIRQTKNAMRLQVALREILVGSSDAAPKKCLAFNVEGSLPHIFRISRYGAIEGKPIACILITNSALAPEVEVSSLAESFALTPTERRLISELASGLSLQESASTLRCKVDTARGYLKQIFQKTGTHRQVDLISLFRNGALPRI